MNRFESHSAQLNRVLRMVVPALITLIILGLFLYAISLIDRSAYDKQLESLENAINRDVLQCYALEGTYPPSLEYLTDHYGLTYNEELFFVDYQALGSNIYPDVTIIPITE